jgi:hypothetical protein
MGGEPRNTVEAIAKKQNVQKLLAGTHVNDPEPTLQDPDEPTV